jgi:hypothetical protein
LRAGDVLLRGAPVTTARGHDREQRLFDRVHRRDRVPAGRAKRVMATRCARMLTRG